MLFVIDGAAFVFIGLLVMATPSPQPALARPIDDNALPPFLETRRLLASQFIGSGLLALVLGLIAPGAGAERAGAIARVVTFAIVLAINGGQLARGNWKRPPLYLITAVLSGLALAYVARLVG